MKMQAELWEKLPDGAVRCDLCFRHCRIGLGEKGFCAVRVNEDDRLLTLVGDSVVKINQAVPGFFTKESLAEMTGMTAGE